VTTHPEKHSNPYSLGNELLPVPNTVPIFEIHPHGEIVKRAKDAMQANK
jgi:hypothetical protein